MFSVRFGVWVLVLLQGAGCGLEPDWRPWRCRKAKIPFPDFQKQGKGRQNQTNIWRYSFIIFYTDVGPV